MAVNYTELAVTAVTLVIIGRAMFRAWRSNKKGWTTWLFLGFGLFASSYAVTNYLSLYPPDATLASQLFWIRVATAHSGPAPVLLLLLAATYPGEKFTFPKWLAALFMAGGLAMCVASFTPFVYSSLRYNQGFVDPQPGPGNILTLGVFLLGTMIAAIVVAVRGYLRAPMDEKGRRLYFLVGLISSVGLTAAASVLPDIFLGTSVSTFIGPIAWVIFFLVVPMGAPKGSEGTPPSDKAGLSPVY